MKPQSSHIVNAFSIDVEDWFQVAAFAPYIDRNDWDSLECRVERNVDLLLELLDKHGVRATFFTLGWIAERYPAMIRRIVGAGHELASHGYRHQMIHELDEPQFREDVVRAKGILEDTGSVRIIGYRAPSFSVGRDTLWALDVLAQTGHQYSSSIYPIKHDLYGMPDAPRFAHYRSGLLEIPATSVRLGKHNFPSSGGGYFRLLPYSISKWSLRQVNKLENAPTVFYCHPWEIDPAQPKMRMASKKSQFRHYVNQKRMAAKLDKLLADFSWDTVERAIYRPIQSKTRQYA